MSYDKNATIRLVQALQLSPLEHITIDDEITEEADRLLDIYLATGCTAALKSAIGWLDAAYCSLARY